MHTCACTSRSRCSACKDKYKLYNQSKKTIFAVNAHLRLHLALALLGLQVQLQLAKEDVSCKCILVLVVLQFRAAALHALLLETGRVKTISK